mgnify:FL=1
MGAQAAGTGTGTGTGMGKGTGTGEEEVRSDHNRVAAENLALLSSKSRVMLGRWGVLWWCVMDETARTLIQRLELAPHPEGGFYRETYRAPLTLLGLPHAGPRSASTAIYFLLPAGVFSALHRVRSDEVWHHYDGDPLELHLLDEWDHQVVILGRDFEKGQVPQQVVRAGVFQAARPLGSRFTLCGCTVAPGFDFADFEMPSREELLAQWPQHEAIIHELTRAK